MGEASQYKLSYSYHKIFFPVPYADEQCVVFSRYCTDFGEKSEDMVTLRVRIGQQVEHDYTEIKILIEERKDGGAHSFPYQRTMSSRR